MQLKPRSEGEIVGIGGDHTAKTYMIHLGLPSGDLVQDVEVYCSDIDDYVDSCKYRNYPKIPFS